LHYDFIGINDAIYSLIVNKVTAGQLLTSNGTEMVALDVRTTGKVLMANSSAANGIEWANLPSWELDHLQV